MNVCRAGNAEDGCVRVYNGRMSEFFKCLADNVDGMPLSWVRLTIRWARMESALFQELVLEPSLVKNVAFPRLNDE